MQSHASIVWWLRIVAAFVIATLVVGGGTRLTDSGLSITQWQPLVGVIPPLTEAGWREAFALYQQIPEYELVNHGMTLGEFQSIYFWEWAHRLVARSIGLVFAIPLAFFWARGMLPGWFKPWGLGLLALGGLQGAVGWWMVTSGLTERVDVSQYRLAVHMTLACVILALAVWLSVRLAGRARCSPVAPGVATLSRLMPFLILGQISLGALVAGLDAGLASDEWPTMAGALIPEGLGLMDPWWINMFENPLTVQFDHRLMGYLVLVVALALAFVARGGGAAGRTSRLAGLVLVQVAIGIATVVWHVPLPLALTHQFVAAVLLWLSVDNATRVVAARRAPLAAATA
ncbi:COX15/CtaA family protein [Acuticoccus sp. I52.16.1]|uniref:COX15/CtaA family protein n=1 Tax=Acuticoccus sp. I52.16.1 TaxID=2928472 RepID=UPI001FD5C237|nr:COX15/CtaA family protein [Acuticoccus sp. I52.16.1]UOM33330.1 COX15/CtaA family protein [Acuticoccus sp. I52.16.1]